MSNTPDKTVHIIVNGTSVEVPEGVSVAAAVLGHSHERYFYEHNLDGSKRSPWCLMGVCFECMLEINGTPNVQSCMVPVAEGMVVKTQKHPAVPSENELSGQGARA